LDPRNLLDRWFQLAGETLLVTLPPGGLFGVSRLKNSLYKPPETAAVGH
jgi:hypothetical protein